MTITTLGVKGMPLLRFKTGDICYHHTEPCACGRNTIRLSSILGRKGQMIKYKGTTLLSPATIRYSRQYPIRVEEYHLIGSSAGRFIQKLGDKYHADRPLLWVWEVPE